MEAPDMDYLNNLSGGDPEFITQIIGIVIDELPGEVLSYTDMITASEMKNASALVHKIKHKLSIFGFKESYRFAVRHEELLRVGDASLHDEFMQILDRLQDYITTHPLKT